MQQKSTECFEFVPEKVFMILSIKHFYNYIAFSSDICQWKAAKQKTHQTKLTKVNLNSI